MTKELNIKNYSVLIDEEDYSLVSNYTWRIQFGEDERLKAVATSKHGKGKCKYNFMHQLIMNGTYVDHINGNPLDNRKSNLRFASPSENNRNKKKLITNTSGYKGVSYDSRNNQQLTKRWKATIEYKEEGKRKSKTIGRFNTPEEAAHVYDEAAIRYFGEFAKLNFPKS